MEVRRTAPMKLAVPDEHRDNLHETAEKFLHCANRSAEFCWDNYDYDDCVTSKAKAERALYDSLRDETDDLHANLVQKAITRAVEAVKSGVERWKNGKRTNQPHFDSWSVLYDKRAATIHDEWVSLATPHGRVECEYVLPKDETRATPYSKYVANDDFEFRTSTLQYDVVTQNFYFHVGTRTYDSDDETDTMSPTSSQSDGTQQTGTGSSR